MKNTNEVYNILKFLNTIKVPVGAVYLSKELEIPQASIGRILLKLEKQGLIEKVSNKGRILTKKGGIYIEKLDAEKSKIDTALSLTNLHEEISKEKLIEILEVRKAVEDKSVELACKNGTKDDFNDLERILAKHIYEIKSDRLGNEEDLLLHLKIAEMSKNETLYAVCKLLLTEENAYTHFSTVTDNIKLTQMKQHESLVNSIVNRKETDARNIMQDHLNTITKDVEKYFIKKTSY